MMRGRRPLAPRESTGSAPLDVGDEMMPVAAPHAPRLAEAVAIAPAHASLASDAPRAGA
jgi:hypothetical protein